METKEIQDAEIIEEVKKPSKKTREQILRDKVKIRMAPDSAGVLIEKILRDNDVVLEGVDWSEGIAPYWLIATVEEDCIGCIQVLLGKPMGMIEFLYLSPSASFKMRAIAAQKLVIQAMSVLYKSGCSYSASTVDKINFNFYNIIEKYAVKIGDAGIFIKRFKN